MGPPGAVVRPGWVDALVPVLRGTEGELRAVLLTGAPGIGKSTTLDAVCHLLDGNPSDEPVRVLRVTADETSRRRPFGLVANLVGIEPEYPPPADTADGVLEAAEKLCADGPCVLCADDVHQADPDSLALLGRLTDAARDLPLTLLLARRSLPERRALVALAARPDVLTVDVAGFDDAGLAELVRERYGAPPGPRLRAVLAGTGGNPFHAGAVLDELARRGLLRAHGDALEFAAAAGSAAVPDTVAAGARAHVALLDEATRDLLALLAVWGGPAEVAQLAAVTGAGPVALLGPVQVAVRAGVLTWAGDLLDFRHDAYRDVVHGDLDPPVLRVLHTACADHLRATGSAATQVLRHADADDPTGPVRALHVAATDLAHAPAQAADLLAQAAGQPGAREHADAIAVARAAALASAGQMRESARVAHERLASTHDGPARIALTRAVVHAMLTAADVGGVLGTLDALDPGHRDVVAPVRHLTVVFGGRESVGPGTVRGAPTRPGLVAAAAELFLRARAREALDLVERARDLPVSDGGPVWADASSASIYPAWFALVCDGPQAARRVSLQARRQAQEQGRSWLMPGHLFVAAGIDYVVGRWDDALAESAAGLEAAAAGDTGWTSRPVAQDALMRICRGELDAAATELTRWRVRGLPEQFGLPAIAAAEAALAEAHGRIDDAVASAVRSWATAMDSGRAIWALIAGVDTARIALAAGDESLLARVHADTVAVPADQAVLHGPAADLVRAMAERDPERAKAAATAFRHRGNIVGELGGWEEAAVAAAAIGNADQARDCAARATALAESLGATTVTRRVAARLRDLRVRVGPPRRRARPTHGWGSLTPTELQVAGLMEQGLTSPQIAARLFLSPRTVQTHVSHCLRKLDLRTRAELAATVARHRG